MTTNQKYGTTLSNLESVQDRNVWINMASDGVAKHSLQNLILELLDESSFYFSQISESNRAALARLFLKYTSLVYFKFDETVKLDQLIKYATYEVYHIQAMNGYRVATKQEVANGVLGLDCEVNRVISEEHEKLLNLLLWAMTGENKYYKAAGYKIRYDENRKSIETPYTLIFQTATGLNDLLNYMEDRYALDLDIKALKAQKKQGKYKYPEYARDQVEAEMPIKTLIFTLNDVLPRGSDQPELRKALAIVLKDIGYKGKPYMKPKLTPKEITFLRKVYQGLAAKGLAVKEVVPSNDIKQLCDDIEEGVKLGYIASDAFALAIVKTIKRYKYSRISSKQKSILDEALRDIKVKQYSKENTANKQAEALKHKQLDEIDSGAVFSIPDSFDELIGVGDDPYASPTNPTNDTNDDDSDNTPDLFDISMMLGDGSLGI